MATRDIIVVGTSAGGMEALQKLVATLPANLPAAIFVVWHLAPGLTTSVLPAVLSRAGPLKASHPKDGDPIVPGRIYVAPNDHHMLLEKGYIRVARGPKENRFRPAVDPLFRSAAYAYGPRVVGVILTGALDDGTAGLWTVKLRGGTAVVQDPADAMHRSMPINALQYVDADYTVPVGEMGALLARLSREPAPAAPETPPEVMERLRSEVKIAEGADALQDNVMQYATLTPYTCPDCHGVLSALQDGSVVRFRCHTGHAYSRETLLESTSEQIEERLWDAVRAMDESIFLLNQMGEEFVKRGDDFAAEQCFNKARDAYERSQPIREAAKQSEHVIADDLRVQGA